MAVPKPEVLSKLASLAAKRYGGTAEGVLRLIENRNWCDSEFLDAEILDAWDSLPMEARLIAYLYAKELSEVDLARQEHHYD